MKFFRFIHILGVALLLGIACKEQVAAQELNARITINHSQIQGTDNAVFDELTQTLTQFVNDRQWTNLQFQKNERINCSFNITVTKYDKSSNLFTCKALIIRHTPLPSSVIKITILILSMRNLTNCSLTKNKSIIS